MWADGELEFEGIRVLEQGPGVAQSEHVSSMDVRAAACGVRATRSSHVHAWSVRSRLELYKARPDVIDSLPLWPFGLDQV